MKFINFEFIRFVIMGVVNTLSSYLIYLFCLLFLSYLAAYTVSFTTGIFIAYYLNAKFVFRAKIRLSQALQYPLIYLAQYLLGLGLVTIIVEWFSVNRIVAPLIALLLTIPTGYLLNKWFLKDKITTSNSIKERL